MINVFLSVLALVWLVLASLQDLKKREVENWLSFSLIAFSSAYVVFNSILTQNLSYFLFNLLGLGVFVSLGFLFYYARVFAGGDAKLIMGLGIVLTSSLTLKGNFTSYLAFIFFLLISASVYGLAYSLAISLKNRKKFFIELKKNYSANKKLLLAFFLASLASLAIPLVLRETLLYFYPLILILFPLLIIYGKSVEACLILPTPYQKVTLGDWLYQKIRLGNKTISPHWEGLNESQLALIKKFKKTVLIKNGIPFVPVFLLAFILFLTLGNSNWGLG